MLRGRSHLPPLGPHIATAPCVQPSSRAASAVQKSVVSLVVATIGRVVELERLMTSLAALRDPALQVVVVDQNMDDRLETLFTRFGCDLWLEHLRSERGLSHARNVGLRRVSGDIVAFPDDDCWYPRGVVQGVREYFYSHPAADGVAGRAVDETGGDVGGRWLRGGGPITRSKIWRQAISYTIFLKRDLTEAVGGFDESLGVGAGTPWESGEETDYLLRAMDLGFAICYEPALTIYHPKRDEAAGYVNVRRTIGYARGMGRVMRKHRYPILLLARAAAASLAGACLALFSRDTGKARVRWARAIGRLEGWRGR